MKIDQLLYFAETARLQHLGRASRSLNISPSAISHSIKTLEQELGCRLFQKQGKNIYLTAHGKKLHLRANELIALSERIKKELVDQKAEVEGVYRVGVTHGLAGAVFVPQWNKFHKKHRKLGLEIFNLRSSQVIEHAAKGEIDFGLCFNPLSHPNINSEVLSEQPLSIAVRRDHPLLKKNVSAQIKGLAEYFCASPKAFQGVEICENHPELARLKIKASIDFVFDSYESAIARLKGSDSWALLPEILIQQHNLRSLELPSWNAKATVAAVWPKDRPLSRTLLELKNLLTDKF